MDGIELSEITAGYGGTDVLRGIDLVVAPGECVAVLGPNGAGKSTLLRVISGQIRPTAGLWSVDGQTMGGSRPFRVVRAGVRWVGDPRPIYPNLSIADNLAIGGITQRHEIEANRESVYKVFPDLAERRDRAAGSLSGGQAQMLAIGQALMSEPRYVLLDEPSLGLAVKLVDVVADRIAGLAQSGVGILWAEQFPDVALRKADRAIVISAGVIIADGPPESITSAVLDAAYMGHAAPGTQVRGGGRLGTQPTIGPA